ncbi:hypothetical protein, partial [Acidithiobacillus thiooxidans]|uniref:hypothetical protein n=1 Tax=Acidithiobacillus thiooxidans TaxID=930 RepID=UPI001EE659D4
DIYGMTSLKTSFRQHPPTSTMVLYPADNSSRQSYLLLLTSAVVLGEILRLSGELSEPAGRVLS